MSDRGRRGRAGLAHPFARSCRSQDSARRRCRPGRSPGRTPRALVRLHRADAAGRPASRRHVGVSSAERLDQRQADLGPVDLGDGDRRRSDHRVGVIASSWSKSCGHLVPVGHRGVERVGVHGVDREPGAGTGARVVTARQRRTSWWPRRSSWRPQASRSCSSRATRRRRAPAPRVESTTTSGPAARRPPAAPSEGVASSISPELPVSRIASVVRSVRKRLARETEVALVEDQVETARVRHRSAPARRRPAGSGSGMLAALIFCFERVIRCAIVVSGTGGGGDLRHGQPAEQAQGEGDAVLRREGGCSR